MHNIKPVLDEMRSCGVSTFGTTDLINTVNGYYTPSELNREFGKSLKKHALVFGIVEIAKSVPVKIGNTITSNSVWKFI